ncbi:hypothetical protein ACWEWX_54055, partial [Streptomyces asiaticus]
PSASPAEHIALRPLTGQQEVRHPPASGIDAGPAVRSGMKSPRALAVSLRWRRIPSAPRKAVPGGRRADQAGGGRKQLAPDQFVPGRQPGVNQDSRANGSSQQVVENLSTQWSVNALIRHSPHAISYAAHSVALNS